MFSFRISCSLCIEIHQNINNSQKTQNAQTQIAQNPLNTHSVQKTENVQNTQNARNTQDIKYIQPVRQPAKQSAR